MVEAVTLFEVGPRDGLQNHPYTPSRAERVTLVELLSDCGFAKIEVASFVNPKQVPKMAGASELLDAVTRKPGVSYAALTPNLRGFEEAVAAKVDEVAVFASASEGFSRANINCSIAESLDRFAPVARAAAAADIPMRGYVSCVTDCPYDGPVLPRDTADVAAKLLGLGCYEVSLGDTLGQATPERTHAMIRAVAEYVPVSQLAGHFHDTSGHALDNIDVSLDLGLRTFDTSVAGLGGCPFAPGASGNVATETVDAHLKMLGFFTGVDASSLQTAVDFAASLGRSE